ncbi:hypothetical protein HF1_05120 [Mycoplasma haemofelis str. Langford 1]|uniref:Uncharacterized protein n=1 Tax=Mycoplasma haemofelis (strain Langford 1) TaxID=941640 RepID=E8ZH99_MYCHL|nr:hypothetical protein [Mycoplasma haemofelis]CBY92520.1 hypothetical protein HF1_05120 [Mycoplasma haemofelis str. Langford 1]
MNSLATRTIAGLGMAGVTGASVAGAWYVMKPKDVKSKLVSEGLTLVGDYSRAWRAVFLTHKDDEEFIKFAGVSSDQQSDTQGTKVASACKRVLKAEVSSEEYDASLNKARKYCTTPKFKTVEAKVLFSDKEISFQERDWKDIFTLHKSDTSFIDKVKAANSNANISSSTQASEAKDKVKKFCDDLKVKDPISEHILDYEKYCLQTPPNVQKFYEQKGYTLVGNGGWGSKFESIKTSDTSLVNEIKGSDTLNESSDGTQGGPKLESWCKTKLAQEINAADPNMEANLKVKSRCFI